MAIKFVAVTFFFQLVVMLPIHYTDTGNWGLPNPIQQRKNPSNETSSFTNYAGSPQHAFFANETETNEDPEATERMLWLYVFFVYLFSGFAIYFIVVETKNIIRIRQDYLGSQSTVTDRTIRLSGVPEELRSEEMIKETIENLQIGKVESVLLCRDWREVDKLVEKRKSVLRKLEGAWADYVGFSPGGGGGLAGSMAAQGDSNGNGENARLLAGHGTSHVEGTRSRPQTRIWYGLLNLQHSNIDAIDYYEEKLRKLDEQIKTSRDKLFKPMPLAFVTLDSTAAAVRSPPSLMAPVSSRMLTFT